MNFGGAVRLNNKAVAVLLVGFAGLYLIYNWTHSESKSAESITTSSKIKVSELLCAAIAAAEAGGDQVRIVREAGGDINEKSKGKTKEGVKDVATDGDMKSHRVMYQTLTTAFPQIKVISEEKDDSEIFVEPVVPDSNCPALNRISKVEWVRSDAVTVWIDPLDATKEYTENLLEYVTTMVCVAVNGKPVIGVIHKPFERKTYWGWVGHAVSKDLLDFNNTPEAENESFIVSRSHTGDKVENLIKSKYNNAKIVTAGGAGFKALEVASHKQGAYVHATYIKKWDVCAGHAVLKALGGHVSTLKDTDITYGPTDPSLIKDGLLLTLSKDFYSKLLHH